MPVTEAPAAPVPAGRVREELAALLSPDVQEQRRRLLWRDRFTSAWSPVTVFGLFFILYLFIVELHTPSYAWAQPALKAVGLLCLLALVGLWLGPLLFRREFRLRRLRSHARELEGEVLEIGDRRAERLDADVRRQMVEQSVRLNEALVSGDEDRLEGALKSYGELAEKPLKPHRRNSSVFFASGLFKALLVALLIRGVLIEPFKIPSGSMIPTLAIGDQIFVNKFIYGVRIPWMNVVPFTLVREPARGDVIVFNNPLDESKDFIKRVVGIPGDRISIRDEVVYINGKPQPRELIASPYFYDHRDEGGSWESGRAVLYRETLTAEGRGEGESYSILQTPGVTNGDEFPEFTVPEDSVFVMGDNRENSSDSRFAFGSYPSELTFVPYGHIKGKAMVIWLSLSRNGFLSGLFEGTGIRTDRFFLPVR